MGNVTYDFKGENFAVTGASSGMGREIALSLAKAGAKVLAIGRDEKRLDGVKSQFPEQMITAQLDVCDDNALEQAIAKFVQEHGKLHGGVHAAGITGITPLRVGNSDLCREIMETSFWAGMDFLRCIIKSTYGEKGSSTVLFSSVCGHSHERGMFAYAAAKAAVESAMRSAAKEICVKGHRVNAIVPGWVQSHMGIKLANELTDAQRLYDKHPLGAGKPENITGIALFLLSEASCWITGSSIVVDGGYLA